jgi:putative spermidine/putrescine transport system ATP-binding protein
MRDTPAKAKLSVRDVSKYYGEVTALRGASLELREGEFLTLLGPSGSGKTTLLMIVAGLVQPSEGDIYIDGKLCTFLPPYKRDIGLVFQNYALFPHLTVFENVAFPLRMRGQSGAQVAKAVNDALEMVHLSHVSIRLPNELSGGQQQRIALARCIVYSPSILLMDEPLGALDRKLRDQMQLEIKSLHRKLKLSFLNVTHDQEEAMSMSDRICLMNNGEIEQIGTPEDLYLRPNSLFVADFLGDSNSLEATVINSSEGLLIQCNKSVLKALSERKLEADSKVALVLRPESLKLLSSDETCDNVVDGVIEGATFVGGTRRYVVVSNDGTKIILKQRTFDGGVRPQEGDRVRIGWQREHGIVLPRI